MRTVASQTSAFQSPDMHSDATIDVGSMQYDSWRFHHFNDEAIDVKTRREKSCQAYRGIKWYKIGNSYCYWYKDGKLFFFLSD